MTKLSMKTKEDICVLINLDLRSPNPRKELVEFTSEINYAKFDAVRKFYEYGSREYDEAYSYAYREDKLNPDAFFHLRDDVILSLLKPDDRDAILTTTFCANN